MAILYSILFGIAVFVVCYHYMQRFLDWLRFQSIGTRDYIVAKLNLMFIEVNPNQVLAAMVACSAVPFLISFLIFLPKLLPGVLFGVLSAIAGWFAPRPIIDYFFNARIQKFNEQMVDGLALMSNGLKSGLSIPQSMGVVVEQMPNPMSQEFNLVLSENKVGVPLEESFNNLSKRVSCEDVDMFVTAINILKETGGNLAETFDTIVYVIRERLKVESKIKALTAQGYYQGMVLLCIPPGLGVYFSVSEPKLMEPLFTNPVGWVLLAVVIGLEVAAYFVVKKVIKVDV